MRAASNLETGPFDTCGYVVTGRHVDMLIQWSDEARVWLSGLRTWKQGGHALGVVPDGDTDAKAAQRGGIVLETRVNSLQDLGWECPAPRVHAISAQPTGAGK